jgi:hypothetical protein
VLEIWGPTFQAIRDEKPYNIPQNRRINKAYLLLAWVDQRQYCSASTAVRLENLAFQIKLDEIILNILKPSRFGLLPQIIWLETIALRAAQWIDTEEIRKQVLRTSESHVQSVAVSACACLLKLRVPGWDRAVVKTLLRFPAETTYFSNQIGKEGGGELLKTFAPFLDNLPASTVMNFLTLAEQSKDKSLLPLLESRLEVATRDKEIAALLRIIGRLGGNPQRKLVSNFIDDDNIYIKVQAIKALGRIGRIKDIRLLIPCLSHPEWWVRYRAARSLISLCGDHSEIVDKIRNGVEDKYARDILVHAAAESEWCLT